MTQYLKTDYNKVFDVWLELYPPLVKINDTVWKQNHSKLKKMYFEKGYTPDDVIDAIKWCKIMNKNVYSIGYLAYIIEESKMYWARRREQEKIKEIEDNLNINNETNITHSDTVKWLNVDDDDDVC